jgi:hypothetical protein
MEVLIMAIETKAGTPRDLLNAASSELAGVRGMLMVLAQHDEGEVGDAIWGVVSLVEEAKLKVDNAIPGVAS